MKTPLFWYKPPTFLSTLFWPLGWIYGQGGKVLRMLKKTEHFPIPVLSIGNIVSGGAGKTPVALALASLLQKKGVHVHFVTRGYGGREEGPLKVNLSHHTPRDVGDEPLLLAQQALTWVSKKKALGVKMAIEEGASLVILDDGHQTTGLYKDLSFVVVDLLQGFGNGYIFPAGPLREEHKEGFNRMDALIGVGEGDISSSKPIFRARLIPRSMPLPSKKVIAFCGLGFPQKFYKMLKDLGSHLVAAETFPDHYMYKEEDLGRLQKLAVEHQAILVTTRKDFVKIPSSWQGRLHVLDVNIEFDDSEGIYRYILQKIPSLKEGV